LKVVTEEAVQMSDGKLFRAVGLAMQNFIQLLTSDLKFS